MQMDVENLVADSGIAIIDFAPFLDASNKQDVADRMLASFKDIGFIYLINHGIPPERIAQMFSLSRTFFAQPLEVKMLAPHPPSGTHHRGYSPPGQEKVVQHLYDPDAIAEQRAQAPDVKESFECGRENDQVMPNIWLPEGVLPGFKETCLDFFWLCHEIELNILRALALGLHLPEDYFLKSHTAPDNQLRLLHYPSVPTEALQTEKIARIGQHSDFGSITLLLQDDVGGLEVEDPHVAGVFRPAPPVPGAIAVNAGDFMMRWSNDTIRSTIHRVRAPPGTHADGMTPERYSIPYFCSADFNTVVDCIPGTWDEERPKKYEPISAQEYIMKRLAASY
ncbi:Clavaminate synthase-like protein [Mycena maculata]|uniref:Clavaminate synthase-like protein n=1 Tax=Mycena maculata TaxID=230809 RepID=A0AAD7HZD6_9AGAR|nr:Clavaminate synthase-like protein [Mycena maculata]